MFAFRFALRNVVSRKSSLVIVLFIAFSISLLCLSNAVFDGTDSGLERTFINSFTGDIVIRPRSNLSLSLFGDDTPIMGEFSQNLVAACLGETASVGCKLDVVRFARFERGEGIEKRKDDLAGEIAAMMK